MAAMAAATDDGGNSTWIVRHKQIVCINRMDEYANAHITIEKLVTVQPILVSLVLLICLRAT